MSIQAQLNQTISLAGLLYSQTPMAEAQRAKRKVEAEKPLVEARLAERKEEAKIAEASAAAKVEERLSLEAKAKEAERQKKISDLTSIHEKTAANVGELTRTNKGVLNRHPNYLNKFEAHISSREAAIKSGEELRGYAPTPELEESIGKWKSEITEMRDLQREVAAETKAKKRAEISKKASRKDKALQEAKESANQALEAEATRLAEDRERAEIRKRILEIGGVR